MEKYSELSSEDQDVVAKNNLIFRYFYPRNFDEILNYCHDETIMLDSFSDAEQAIGYDGAHYISDITGGVRAYRVLTEDKTPLGVDGLNLRMMDSTCAASLIDEYIDEHDKVATRMARTLCFTNYEDAKLIAHYCANNEALLNSNFVKNEILNAYDLREEKLRLLALNDSKHVEYPSKEEMLEEDPDGYSRVLGGYIGNNYVLPSAFRPISKHERDGNVLGR